MVDERSLITTQPEQEDYKMTRPKRDDYNEGEAEKEKLQHDMEEARDSISHTIGEIGSTVSFQAQAIRETISKKLDWREHARKHPAAVGIGALAFGFVIGYSVIGAINKKSNGRGRLQYSDYALQESAGHHASALQTPTNKKHGPGLLTKIKSTRAFNHLSDEASHLADQFVDEMINVGKTVLIPAAVNKISETIRSGLGKSEETSNQSKQEEGKLNYSSKQTAS
jgi:hypothetical protein